MRILLLAVLIFSISSFASNPANDWVDNYHGMRQCAKFLVEEIPGKDKIPSNFIKPLLAAYKSWLSQMPNMVRNEIDGTEMSIRETISFNGERMPVLAIIEHNGAGVFYAVKTKEGIRIIIDCYSSDLADLYEEDQNIYGLPFYGRYQNLIMTEYWMGLPESVLASENKLEELGLDFNMAMEISLWAEKLFAKEYYTKGYLELTSGRTFDLE